ncbi:glycoside hydrolase family 25 protein [Streptomyces spongiicola]|uniref:glycoside hydrolase family 25 protein n=1 Tax=Streptomyces spongiicola TaxID=1690221 RepID=UPI001FE4E896|nr:glycoside hydrolase family 25 protein [Streptomyces spongiicola]
MPRRPVGKHLIGITAAAVALVLGPHPEALAPSPASASSSSSAASPAPAPASAPGGPAGVDTSAFNHGGGGEPIDWNRAAAGNAFVFMKATQGTRYRDPWFAEDFAAASRTSLLRAPYHFFDARGPYDAAAQARHFARTARAAGYTGRRPGELPPVLDVESTWVNGRAICPPHAGARQIAALLRHVEADFGVRPVVYTDHSFVALCLGGDARVLKGYQLWLPGYEREPRDLPGTDQGWTFWQYTDRARVPGIPGPVDRSVYRGSLRELRTMAGITGAPGDSGDSGAPGTPGAVRAAPGPPRRRPG